MGLNLSTILAGEGVTVNTVGYSLSPISYQLSYYQILPAMIGSTDMIPTPKVRYVLLSPYPQMLTYWQRTWTSNTDLEALKETDPGLAIAASIPVHRLGQPQEVANVAVM